MNKNPFIYFTSIFLHNKNTYFLTLGQFNDNIYITDIADIILYRKKDYLFQNQNLYSFNQHQTIYSFKCDHIFNYAIFCHKYRIKMMSGSCMILDIVCLALRYSRFDILKIFDKEKVILNIDDLHMSIDDDRNVKHFLWLFKHQYRPETQSIHFLINRGYFNILKEIIKDSLQMLRNLNDENIKLRSRDHDPYTLYQDEVMNQIIYINKKYFLTTYLNSIEDYFTTHKINNFNYFMNIYDPHRPYKPNTFNRMKSNKIKCKQSNETND